MNKIRLKHTFFTFNSAKSNYNYIIIIFDLIFLDSF